MTHDQFTALVLGWIGAFTVITLAVGAALVKVWPVVLDIRAKVAELRARQDRQGARQNEHEKTLTQIALSTPPPPKPTTIQDHTQP